MTEPSASELERLHLESLLSDEEIYLQFEGGAVLIDGNFRQWHDSNGRLHRVGGPAVERGEDLEEHGWWYHGIGLIDHVRQVLNDAPIAGPHESCGFAALVRPAVIFDDTPLDEILNLSLLNV